MAIARKDLLLIKLPSQVEIRTTGSCYSLSMGYTKSKSFFTDLEALFKSLLDYYIKRKVSSGEKLAQDLLVAIKAASVEVKQDVVLIAEQFKNTSKVLAEKESELDSMKSRVAALERKLSKLEPPK